MKQVATIFRKDFERLWPLWLIVLAFTGFHLFGVTQLGANTSIIIAGPLSLFWLVASLSDVLLPVALVVTLAFLIQEEPLVGSNAFWLTRPYSRKALVVEKVLFIAVFAFLPMLVHDLIATGWFGVGGSALLFILKDLELAGLLICAAAFAVLTAGFGRFTLLVLVSAVAFGLLVLTTNMPDARNWGVLSGVSGLLAWSVAAIGATIVALNQYRTRRVVISAIIGAISLTLAALVLSYFPWNLAWTFKQWFGIPAASLDQVQLIPTPDASDAILDRDSASSDQTLPFRTILYPFRVAGLPNDVSLDLFRGRTELKSASASPPLVLGTHAFFRNHQPLPHGGSGGAPDKQLVTIGMLPRLDFERLSNSKVTLAGSAYFEAYRDLKQVRVPLPDREIPILIDRERCRMLASQVPDRNFEKKLFIHLNCVELEPPSGILMAASLVDKDETPIWWHSTGVSESSPAASYSLPSLLSPVHQSSITFEFGRQPSDAPSIPEGTKVIISARKPIGLLRRDFLIEDVRLKDLEGMSWKQRGTANYPAAMTH
ncbi:MAG TPA: hypothetical protein VH325_17340 [Bryobacteraceae bacterium]|jgi:hypothetical protein|nr:hypothetical protein [Bryobacteraceae bacterium]